MRYLRGRWRHLAAAAATKTSAAASVPPASPFAAAAVTRAQASEEPTASHAFAPAFERRTGWRDRPPGRALSSADQLQHGIARVAAACIRR